MLRRKKKKSASKTTSTPVPVPRPQSPYDFNSSTTYTKVSSICSDGMLSSSQESISPILQSSVAKQNTTRAKRNNKQKLPKVKIYHEKKTPKGSVEVRHSEMAESASSQDVYNEAPIPKRRRIREIANKRRGRETEERTLGQFPCKSVEVVDGSIIDLRLIYKREFTKCTKIGDINYSVGTATEQFRWGILEIVGRGVKPTSLSKEWMLFHLMSGSIQIYLDSKLIATLDKVGDTFLVPPGSIYEFNNLYSKKAVCTYMIIMRT